jgi:hypothetical protein
VVKDLRFWSEGPRFESWRGYMKDQSRPEYAIKAKEAFYPIKGFIDYATRADEACTKAGFESLANFQKNDPLGKKYVHRVFGLLGVQSFVSASTIIASGIGLLKLIE